MRTGKGRNTAALTDSCAAAILLGLVFSAPVASGQTTTFSDGTFNDQNWFVDTHYAGGTGNASGGQQTSGGDPGSYYRLTISTTAGPSGLLAFVRNNPGFIYNPSTQGPINSIAFSFNLESQAGVGTAFVNLAIEQNFQNYVGPEYDTTSMSWVNFSDSLTASSFSLVTSVNGEIALDSSSHPDFSANGAGISFGFSSILNADPGNEGGSETMGVDNYHVVLNPVAVPEPATMVFLGSALGALAVMRWRRK